MLFPMDITLHPNLYAGFTIRNFPSNASNSYLFYRNMREIPSKVAKMLRQESLERGESCKNTVFYRFYKGPSLWMSDSCNMTDEVITRHRHLTVRRDVHHTYSFTTSERIANCCNKPLSNYSTVLRTSKKLIFIQTFLKIKNQLAYHQLRTFLVLGFSKQDRNPKIKISWIH